MPLNTRPFLFIAAGVIIAFLVLGLLRNSAGSQLNANANNSALMKPLTFALFLVFGFCIVPIFLKVFLLLASRTGNADVPLARFISTHSVKLMYGVWGFFAVGVVIALPAMIKDGFFKTDDNSIPGSLVKDHSEMFATALYPICHQKKWGYMDSHFRVVIAPVFEEADDFHEGMAAVSSKEKNTEDARFGFIDSLGKLVVPYRYEKAWSFSEGLAAVSNNGTHGYIDKTGREVVPLIYEEVSSFSEGLAAVKIEGRNGFIDSQGKMVIQPQFVRSCQVSDFSEGLAPVYTSADDRGGYIDKNGEFVIPPSFGYVDVFSEGLALVKPTGNPAYGYIDRKGKMVIQPRFDLSLPFTEGVASVKVRRPDGSAVFNIIDKKGNKLSPDLNYAFVGIFREGLAGVETHDLRWGFIDKTGKEIIRPAYAGATLFRNGLCRLHTGSLFKGLRTVYIDKKGKVVWKE